MHPDQQNCDHGMTTPETDTNIEVRAYDSGKR